MAVLLPVSDGLGVAHAVPEQLLHPRPALAQDAEPRQPRPRSCSVAPVIRHHAILTFTELAEDEVVRWPDFYMKKNNGQTAPRSKDLPPQ